MSLYMNPYSYITQHVEWITWHDANARCDAKWEGSRCYGMREPGSTCCAAHRDQGKPVVVKATRKPREDAEPLGDVPIGGWPTGKVTSIAADASKPKRKPRDD